MFNWLLVTLDSFHLVLVLAILRKFVCLWYDEMSGVHIHTLKYLSTWALKVILVTHKYQSLFTKVSKLRKSPQTKHGLWTHTLSSTDKIKTLDLALCWCNQLNVFMKGRTNIQVSSEHNSLPRNNKSKYKEVFTYIKEVFDLLLRHNPEITRKTAIRTIEGKKHTYRKKS